VDPAFIHLNPHEHWRLALVHPVMSELLFGFVSLGKRRQLLGVIEERLQPGISVGSLKAGDQGFKRRHEHSLQF
jgi:hypothetical protein